DLLDHAQARPHLEPLQHLVGQRVVVLAAVAVGGVLVNALAEGRGGLELDVRADHGIEHDAGEHLLRLRQRLRADAVANAEIDYQVAQDGEGRVRPLRRLYGLRQVHDPLQRVILGRHGHDHVGAGDECLRQSHAERRGAVYDDEVVFGEPFERVFQTVLLLDLYGPLQHRDTYVGGRDG